MARELNHSAVRVMRELVGLSGRELARRCGLSEGSMSNIEHGLHKVAPDTQRKIADVLGVPLDSITIVIPEPADADAEPVPS